MKTIFRLRYKMHKLANLLFYLLIFLIGFVAGKGDLLAKISNFVVDLFK